MNSVLQLGLNSLVSKLDEVSSLIALVNNANTSNNNLDLTNVISKSSIMLIASYFEDFMLYTVTEYINTIIRNECNIKNIPDGIKNSVYDELKFKLNKEFRNIYSGKESFLEFSSKVDQKISKVKSLFEFVEGDLTSNVTNQIVRTNIHLRATEVNRLFKIAGINEICTELSKSENLGDYHGFKSKNLRLKNRTKIQERIEKHLAEFYKYRNSIVHPYNKANMPYSRTLPDEIKFFRAFAEDLCKFLDTTI